MDIAEILSVLVSGVNGVAANATTLGLWYLLAFISQRARPMLQGVLPPDILNPLFDLSVLYIQLFIFHHVALK